MSTAFCTCGAPADNNVDSQGTKYIGKGACTCESPAGRRSWPCNWQKVTSHAVSCRPSEHLSNPQAFILAACMQVIHVISIELYIKHAPPPPALSCQVARHPAVVASGQGEALTRQAAPGVGGMMGRLRGLAQRGWRATPTVRGEATAGRGSVSCTGRERCEQRQGAARVCAQPAGVKTIFGSSGGEQAQAGSRLKNSAVAGRTTCRMTKPSCPLGV